METNRSWSIDDRRYQFQFFHRIGWENQRGGKKVRMLKIRATAVITEPSSGIPVMLSADSITGTLWGTPNCGKGQPMANYWAQATGLRRRAFAMCASGRHFQTNETAEQGSRGASTPSATFAASSILFSVWRNPRSPKKPKSMSTKSLTHLTRFANNGIHQNVAEHGLTVSIRTVTDGRTARATTNRNR